MKNDKTKTDQIANKSLNLILNPNPARKCDINQGIIFSGDGLLMALWPNYVYTFVCKHKKNIIENIR